MSKLEFNPNNHRYTIEGKALTGVTTILGVIAKNNLIQWAADMAAIYGLEDKQIIGIKTKYEEIQKISDWKKKKIAKDNLDKEYPEYKQARTAHCQKRDKAGDTGTRVHSLCEDFINTKKVPDIKDPKEKKMFDNFYLWQKANKVKFLGSERRVFSEKFWFAGTYDFLCEIDGKIWLGDIKTGSGIYPEMFFQCAGYQICEEEMNPKIKIDGYIIVNLKKDGKFDEKRSISNKNNKQAFLSALNLYRAINKVESDTLQ